jgi:hypothetical protein
MREKTRSGKLGDWQRLLAALHENEADLPELVSASAQLGTLVGQAGDLFQQQAALSASKQTVSQQLVDLMAECDRLSTVVRFTLKQHYGPRSERLVEFGIQPFRPRVRKPGPPPPPPESPESPEPEAAG